jgi:alkyl sulfatase BDS1-like metallo-beta-lactamase superfamily hydrolase
VRNVLRFCFLLLIVPLARVALAEQPPKPATAATKAANARVLRELPFNDQRDFEDARRGLIAPLPDNGLIKSADGRVVWNLSQYQVANSEVAPDTVNPSLWRQMRLLTIAGLFQVTPRIYQVRGADISNITFIEGATGVIVMDPLISAETAHAALELYRKHRGNKPVVAVIFTHSHVDHYGGALGVVDPADVKAGKVKIVAPEHFLEEAVSENLLAGNHMLRRASYMYGRLLPQGPSFALGSGLGLGVSSGSSQPFPPTDIITKTGQTLTLDGLSFEFLMAPGSEAPAEMHFYIPELKALCTAENANHSLHNLYTLRGAKVRDARAWAGYLQQTIERWPHAEVLFAPHFWPTWGNQRVMEHLKKQRDLYKFINDQTLRLANKGYNMVETASMIQLPQELASDWSSRGYYGSISHNVRATWNYYLGFFDGNPARLDPLPPAEAGKHFVEYMGGADAVLAKARKDFDAGNYRWVAQVLDQVVSAEPDNQAAKNLLADALEQLGYQSENASWRNFYLSGAQELRNGLFKFPVPFRMSEEGLSRLPTPEIFDYLAIRFNGAKASGKRAVANIKLADSNELYSLVFEDGVLIAGRPLEKSDVTLAMTKKDLAALALGTASLEDKIKSGAVQVTGDPSGLEQMLALTEKFDFWWNVSTPNPPER